MNLKHSMAHELLKADFEGLYGEHRRANDDFASSRFRTVLAVQAVPLLAIGALLSASKSDTSKLDVFDLPSAIYAVFLASAVLGFVVCEMWIHSAFTATTYARALNRLRGRYLSILKEAYPLDAWDSWLPATPAQPNWVRGKGSLCRLFAVVEGINSLYLGVGLVGSVSGVQRLDWAARLPVLNYVIVLAFALVGGALAFSSLSRRIDVDQASADRRAGDVPRGG